MFYSETDIDCSIEPTERITKFEGNYMIIISAVADIVGLVGIIPFVGFIPALLINLFLFITLWIWFRIHNVSAFEKIERLVIKLAPMVIENIPFVNIIPSWTFSTMLLTFLIRKDDAKRKEAWDRVCIPQRHVRGGEDAGEYPRVPNTRTTRLKIKGRIQRDEERDEELGTRS